MSSPAPSPLATPSPIALDTAKTLDVVALGNAIVDILARVDDAFLERHGVAKGAMTLIDGAYADQIYTGMADPREVSGGSAANTIVGLASLGAKTAFAGKVKDDPLGSVFREDIRRMGIAFETPPFGPETAGATARSMVLVTPDAERSMLTDLGVSTEFAPGDLPEAALEACRFVYLEGYLWDKPASKAAFTAAMERTKAAGGAVALTLSDTFCVDRHRASFLEIIAGPVDVLFANEAELLALFETDDFDAAAARVADLTALAVITRSERGCVACAGTVRVETASEPIEALVDTTGAGDLFAAGYLFGLAQGRDLETCGRMGCATAAEVIQHLGARPEADLRALFDARGLL